VRFSFQVYLWAEKKMACGRITWATGRCSSTRPRWTTPIASPIWFSACLPATVWTYSPEIRTVIGYATRTVCGWVPSTRMPCASASPKDGVPSIPGRRSLPVRLGSKCCSILAYDTGWPQTSETETLTSRLSKTKNLSS